jgi:FkbM family methyltransferase
MLISKVKRQLFRSRYRIKNIENKIGEINRLLCEIREIYSRIDDKCERDKAISECGSLTDEPSIPFIEYMRNPGFINEYKSLLSGLDEESCMTVHNILSRIRLRHEHPTEELFIYNEQERIIFQNLMREFWPGPIKINDECFAYKNYLLPINHFEPCVFRYKHFIESLNLAKIHDADIIDAGGFIGDSALVLSQYTRGRVHTFEPIPEHCELMRKTIELNELKNVTINACGLGKHNGHKSFTILGSSSSSFWPGTNHEKCPVVTLDKYAQDKNLEIGLIKTDLEGGEMDFLYGAEQTIKAQQPSLIISIYHIPADFFGIKPLLANWNPGYKFKIMKPIDGQIYRETVLLAEIGRLE